MTAGEAFGLGRRRSAHAIDALRAGLGTHRSTGACPDCDADERLVELDDAPGVFRLSVLHDDTCPPGERAELLRLAALIPDALPIVAGRPRVTFRRLTGPGPREWEPWTPDTVGAAA